MKFVEFYLEDALLRLLVGDTGEERLDVQVSSDIELFVSVDLYSEDSLEMARHFPVKLLSDCMFIVQIF